MHESHTAEELIEEVDHHARENGIVKVTKVGVSLGKESDITEDALNTWFDLLKKDTIAEQAVLEIEIGEGSSIMLISLEGEETPCSQAESV
jgi:Zn finger protein HypA/HybF involved in hydrogenase expression